MSLELSVFEGEDDEVFNEEVITPYAFPALNDRKGKNVNIPRSLKDDEQDEYRCLIIFKLPICQELQLLLSQ